MLLTIKITPLNNRRLPATVLLVWFGLFSPCFAVEEPAIGAAPPATVESTEEYSSLTHESASEDLIFIPDSPAQIPEDEQAEVADEEQKKDKKEGKYKPPYNKDWLVDSDF